MPRLENYFNLPKDDQITIIQSLQNGDSKTEQEWYEVFPYIYPVNSELVPNVLESEYIP